MLLGEFEQEGAQLLTPGGLAARLRELAQRVEAGEAPVSGNRIKLPPQLQIKVELEEERVDGEVWFEIEIELSWPFKDAARAGQAAAEPESDEVIIAQARFASSPAGAARRLHRLAERIDGGRFRFLDHPVRLPREAELKIEGETGEEGGEVEFEIRWKAWDGMGPSGFL